MMMVPSPNPSVGGEKHLELKIMYKSIFSMKKIKLLLTAAFVFISFQSVFSQSPSYSLKVKVPHEKGYAYHYKSSLCKVNSSSDQRWFTGEISDIDWSKVDMKDYYCYELQNRSDEGYSYSNQIHVYEQIANITILRTDGELVDWMQIVFPFKVESFVTSVDLTGIEFRPGVYDLTNAFEYDTTNYLEMRLKEGYEWVDVKESNLLND